MLDVNALAEGHEFYALGQWEVSSGQHLLAFSADAVGRRIYTIQFKDLATGELLPDTIPEVTGNMAWANDDRTLFYGKQDPVTLRSYRICRHVLGSSSDRDELIYEEADDTFNCYVFKTKSKAYVMIGSFQTLSAEYRYLDADRPGDAFKVFLPRRREHEYTVDHYGDHFYVVTNDQAKNFRLMRTPVDRTAQEHWEEVIAHRPDVLLEGIEILRDFLVVVERANGLIQMRIKPWSGGVAQHPVCICAGGAGASGGEEHYIDFGEPAYRAYVGDNYDLDTPLLRYGYTSMTMPNSVYDYHAVTREKTLLKREEVLGGFDSDHYVTERLHAEAEDGTRVPISIVYRKGTARDGSSPHLLYGYGSYGYSMDAAFDPFRVGLLDRGFTYAIAHVRGGQELGRPWYEDGKLLKKKNTFTDFVACAEYLVREGYANPKALFAMGGSAGGLLMGAILNMRPDLWTGVLSLVPFVDVVTTMLDESIPLTTGEYDEWGNPNDREGYAYMLSYSPYDNVEAKDYPHILAITSLHDSQVQYWEPAKWVAKLRALKADGNRLLLRTKMEAGHGGVSGRYKRYRETAFQFAFLLDLAGIDR